MNDPNIFRGPHLSHKHESLEWRAEAVGLKAVGLTQLPLTWTPPFIVITTAAYNRWKEKPQKQELRNSLAPGLDHILGLNPGRIIVRSSAYAENIDCRGWLESVRCTATHDDVLTTAERVWARANATPKITEKGFGLVVQQFIAPKLHGHLSNERRVSGNRAVWLCEVETPMAAADTKAFRFRVKIPHRQVDTPALLCSTQDLVIERLRDVAYWCVVGKDRNHLEWVWDGERLWIVQRDIEKLIHGDQPACSPIPPPLLSVQPPDLKVFERSNESMNWKKTESLRLFERAGMKVADLYILQKSSELTALAGGKVSAALKADLKELLESPIVFRTDFLTPGKMPKLLSIRSNTLSSLDEAMSWLVDKAQKIMSEGIASSDFCFIAHRYIPARSGAMCLANPERPLVRIDAIWGFPDGLQYFPHDTFHVSGDGGGKIERRIRCKPFCLSEDDQGNWVPNKSPVPWDWRSCLKDSEIREIAKFSRAVALHLKQPVSIMFFIGVDHRTGYPPILPWVHFEEMPKGEEEADRFYYAGKSFSITNSSDLKRLEPAIIEARKTDKVAIHLRPITSLIRDKNFVNAVADAAIQLNVPVQLEGSILSHIYYMLTQRGVKVRCIGATHTPRNRRRFGKLIRDLIPVRIRAGGEIARTFQVPKDELIKMLKAKALEETFELFRAEDPDLAFEELVDIFEVVLSACKAYGRTFEDLTELAAKKRAERGGFEKGIVLIETEAVPLFGTPPSEFGLFGSGEPMKTQAKNRSRKPSQPLSSFDAGRRPRTRGADIAIPMIPPHPSEKAAQTILAIPDSEFEAVIRYMAKEVLVSVRKRPAAAPNPDQMWLGL